jgi:hypothetical protein
LAEPIPQKAEEFREVEDEGQVTAWPRDCMGLTPEVSVWLVSSTILKAVSFALDQPRKGLSSVKVERSAYVHEGLKRDGDQVECVPHSLEPEMVVLRSLETKTEQIEGVEEGPQQLVV